MSDQPALKTPLYDLHLSLEGKMVDFAGWMMPVNYPMGIMAEHHWCRQNAGLFDVSHMGQIEVWGEGAELALEALVPSSIDDLPIGKARYSTLLNDQGGIEDDLIISKALDKNGKPHLFIVVNASRFDHDLAILQKGLRNFKVIPRRDLALIALQGPRAEKVLSPLLKGIDKLSFMETALYEWQNISCRVSRLGYTGEDGFEISLPATEVENFAKQLLAHEDCKPIGLGARDSLRLEAGLCLYGNDIDQTTSPIEANLAWIIQKHRRNNGGFVGESRVLAELTAGASRKLVGILPDGRAPARRGVIIADMAGAEIGIITSGGFSPTLNAPISIGYVDTAYLKNMNEKSSALNLIIRDKLVPASIVKLPFVPHHYKK